MTDLLPVFWLWKGWRPIYSHEHVNTACRMLREHMSVDRIVCITDMPKGITECETYPLWPEWENLRTTTRPNCWRRLKLFQPGFIAEQLRAERVLSMDIDFVPMTDSLDYLLPPAHGVPFKIVKGHYAVYNGSMWYMQAGVHPQVWNAFDPQITPTKIRHARHPFRNGARMIGSDQAWLSIALPRDTAVWTKQDGVVSYARHSIKYRDSRHAKLWLFPGGVKPWSQQCKKALRHVYDKYMSYWRSSYPPTHGSAGIPA